MRKILCLAGFADGAAMYEPLKNTPLSDQYELIALDLPGFASAAAEPLDRTTLESLAGWVDRAAREQGADMLMAHSVASIIASFAAGRPDSPVRSVISLEGNLTAEDAYFSGRAAQYAEADSFKREFIAMIEDRAGDEPILARYAQMARQADARAMWELGCDAHHFSQQEHPGERLKACGRTVYVFNPDNCARASLDWLAQSGMECLRLDGASHWPTIDAAGSLADGLLKRLQAVTD